MNGADTLKTGSSGTSKLDRSNRRTVAQSVFLVALMVFSTLTAIDFVTEEVSAASDLDGDGLTYGLEYLINTAATDWDSDNDGLPDGWEWKYGLDPLSATGGDGAVGDPDGDGMSNLQEYSYLQPSNWDNPATTGVLDNGVWWNGTIPVNDWNEEDSMQFNQPKCGDTGSDGQGNTILCDEDPVGNVCANGFDDDKDGQVDGSDSDNDGDADCSSDDDDGDGVADEDPNGWDTDGDGMPDGWEAANGLNATSASNADGANGDPDGDGLINLMEYVNPSWTTNCGGVPCFRQGPDGVPTETVSPCDPVQGIGPGACATLTAEVDGVTSTNPQDSDTDNDGLNDSYEALTLLTDPTSSDTDSDGIPDGVEINGAYGNPPQASDPRDNNTDGDAFDDGDEDANGNGIIDAGETDPTRREDSGDQDNDGIQNWEENLSCTEWNVADTDFGGINDGDERNVSHGTDPCDSLVNFATTFVSFSAANQLFLADATGFNPNGGIGYYNNSGTYTTFSYLSASSTSNALQGVSPAPAGTPTSIESRNGSFCHTAANQDGTIGTTRTYCDDDYTDSDADGLADWEELLGTYGWFSNPTLADTDGDGVSDYDEVFDNTDPTEPCFNTLDPDGDGINSYFENTTGCNLAFIGINNGSTDIWVTDYLSVDTDSGGVDDRTEYFDNTNPENDPSDDLLPDDFDNDGIPDAVENATGSDWRNPDTDGGGMLDGAECPQQFWFFNCVGAPFNLFDPTDDLPQNDVIFWANNTTGVVDLDIEKYWRKYTNDIPTGNSYTHDNSVHPATEVVPPFTNLTHMASTSFANDTITWQITYNFPVGEGALTLPASTTNVSFWADSAVILSRTNDTHRYEVDGGFVEEIVVQQPEYYFDWSTLASSSIAGQGFPYETALPDYYTDLTDSRSVVYNITSAVINDASAVNAYDQALALQTFLRDGNATTEFKLNFDGSGLVDGEDLTQFMLEVANEGTCAEFATTYVTMARVIGLPARLVSGFKGGDWTGNGYAIGAQHLRTWAEVRLQQSSAAGGLDFGWVPFDPCPDAAELDISNVLYSPTDFDRDGSAGNISISGNLLFLDNQTAIEQHIVRAYLVPLVEAFDGVSGLNTPERLLEVNITDSSGFFTIEGAPVEMIQPGFGAIMIEVEQKGYVSGQTILTANSTVQGPANAWWMNVTDDATLNHTSPGAIDAPIVGAGATTTIEGFIGYEQLPFPDASLVVNSTVWLSFTSSVDGAQNLTTQVSPSGTWSFELTLDELETKTNVSATLGYDGWVQTEDGITGPTYHLRPTQTAFTLDIRDAPNLTATLEGPGTNSSLLLLNNDIYVNGTALTIGASPVGMAGNLSFEMRENNSGGDWTEIFNVTVNGAFNIQHFLNASDVNVAAGILEVRLRFYPDLYESTDDANLSTGDPYALVGILNFEVIATPQLRGEPTNVLVQISDHMGVEVGLAVPGDYSFSFDGTWVNTTTDPDSSLITLSWQLDSTLRPGDYVFDILYNGSTLYQPGNDSGLIRVQAEIGWNLTILQDWTHLGNTTYIVGDIFDGQFTTERVLGNDTIIAMTMLDGDGFPIDLANGMLDNATGEFNLTVVMPTTLPSNGYEVAVDFNFEAMAPAGGAYYRVVDSSTPPNPPTLPSLTVGIESEFLLEEELSAMEFVSGDQVTFNTSVLDVADRSNVSGVSVEYIWDFGNSNQTIGTAVTDAEGNASFTWLTASLAPGDYVLQMFVADDLTDPLAVGNSRRTGNSTFVDVTVQVPTDIRIDVLPSTITAGVPFNMQGQILDDDDPARAMISGVRLDVYWQSNPEERLRSGVPTLSNGSFNLTVPTDTANNGTVRGPRTLVVEVLEDSSPYYLPSNTSSAIFVFGVTQLEGLQPGNPVLVNRGETVNLSATLVESSFNFRPLGNLSVTTKFHETWLPSVTTDGSGTANTSFAIPSSHPLGLIVVSYYYNGSSDLLPTQANLSSVTVRSLTFMVVDPITDNPVAGSSFNVSGRVVSDNGSGLTNRDGSRLIMNVLFTIDDAPTGFAVSNGSVQDGGWWNATITLTPGFERGTHVLEASIVPTVNFYIGSKNNSSFDSRGFSIITFLDPSLDALGQPSLNDRTERGDLLDIRILLEDNTGAPIDGQQVTFSLPATNMTDEVSVTVTTVANGTAVGSLLVPFNASVGFSDVVASYDGITGSTGLIGYNTSTQFVALAETNLTIAEHTESLVAGEMLYVNGTLLDDLNMPLYVDGIESVAIVRLFVDGVPVASVQSDAFTGAYAISYLVPESTTSGMHMIEVRFTGGRDWVDPVGIGDSVDPEFYMPSSATVDFNVSVPTQILLITPTGEVNREETMTVQGRLLDVVDNPLQDLTIDIYLNDVWMTNVTTDETGLFTAVIPVPADAALGPVSLDTRFNGTVFYLPSDAGGTWTVFSQILVSVSVPSPLAVTDTTTITGSVLDNQLEPIEGHVVELKVDGFVLSQVTTGADGTFSYEWTVQDFFNFGDKLLEANVLAQGYYREGSANQSFFLAHRSAMTLEFDDGTDATRGDLWTFSGRLYDIDTVDQDGIGGESVLVYLDGQYMSTVTTASDGTFSGQVYASMDLERGNGHIIQVVFEGTQEHLSTLTNGTVTVWADIVITIDSTSSPQSVRSDPANPIRLTGSVAEIGGIGEVFEDVVVYVGNGTNCVNNFEGAVCFDGAQVDWNIGNFTIVVNAPLTLSPGSQFVSIDVPRDTGRYINGASESHPIYIKVNAEIEIFVDKIEENVDENVDGQVTIVAEDTTTGLAGIAVEFYLYAGNGSQLGAMTKLTDAEGVADFEFNRVPPEYGDTSVYGQVSLDIIINDPRLSDQTVAEFNISRQTGFAPVYEFEAEASEVSPWTYVALVFLAAAVALGTVMYRRTRQNELLSEMSEVFEYTAELLAAGDATREAIFNCYQNLCSTLQTRGLLRRDFETVREFEVAIRQATPGISDEALESLDNMFEMARYSREELGASHQQSAQTALDKMITELSYKKY